MPCSREETEQMEILEGNWEKEPEGKTLQNSSSWSRNKNFRVIRCVWFSSVCLPEHRWCFISWWVLFQKRRSKILCSIITGVVKYVLSNNSNLEGTLVCSVQGETVWWFEFIALFKNKQNPKTNRRLSKHQVACSPSDCNLESLLDVLQSSLKIFLPNNWH